MKNLKILREKRKQTQLNLGIQIGVQQETISAYENGKALPAADTLLKLAEYYNCSIDYLLDLTDVKTQVKDLLIGNLNAQEAEIISAYRELPTDKKNKLIGFIEGLSQSC